MKMQPWITGRRILDNWTEYLRKRGKYVENKKKSGTFVVHIKCCENATWQGEVTWAEENKKENFRSALELIRLIDGALDMSEEE